MKSSISLAPGVAPRETASCPSQHSCVSGADLLELVPILDQPDAVQRRACVADGGREERAQAGVCAGELGAQPDAACLCDCRHGGKRLGQPGDRVEVEAESALPVADHLVRSGQLLRDRHLVTHHHERALAVASDDEARRTPEVAPVAAEVVDVVGAEDDGAVDLLVVHPVAQALEPVGRSRRRDGHGTSLRAGGCRACEYVILDPKFRITRNDFKS